MLRSLNAGALVVSVVVLVLFGVVVAGWTPTPDGGILDLLKEAVTGVVWYWLGQTSSGHAAQQAAIASAKEQ